MPNKAITVLITGPIGSGKSEVSKYLMHKGYPVYDCDSRCKELYDTVPGIKERIEKELSIPFAQLATVFADSSKLQKLEAIIYPELLSDIRKWKQANDTKIKYIESAIALQKSVFKSEFDKVLLVTAPYETRLARNPKVAERDSMQSFKPEQADYIIENDSTVDELYSKIDKYLKYEQEN